MVDTYLYNTNSNKIVIPWSGGVDSTHILFKVIKYLSENKEILDKVRIFLVSIKGKGYKESIYQGKAEKKARNKIYKYIKKNYPFVFEKIQTIEIEKDYTGHDISGMNLYQPYWWLTTIFSHFGNNFTLLFGYHKGDDFWLSFDKFQKLFSTSKEYFDYEINRYISYPVARMYKDEIFEYLPQKIKKMVSYCENPNKKGKPCGKCPSCKEHKKFIK